MDGAKTVRAQREAAPIEHAQHLGAVLRPAVARALREGVLKEACLVLAE